MTYQFLLLRLYTQCPLDVSPGMETWLPCHHSSHSAFTIQLHAALFGLPSPPRQRKYLRQFLQVSEVSSLSLHLSRHLVPSLLSLGNEVVASGDFPKALLTSGTWAKRSRLLPEPFPSGLKSLRKPCWCLRTTLSNVIFTMISAFISRQTSACPLLAYNTKLKSLDEE